MFRRVNEEQLLRKPVKEINSGNLNKLRILDSLPLRKINDSQSVHTSVMSQSRHSSIKHLPNASLVSSEFSMRSSLIKSRSIEKKNIVYNKQQTIEQLLERHYNSPFIRSLVHYLNREWSQKEKQLLQQKKIQNFVQSVIQRSNWIKDLVDQFVEKEYSMLPQDDRYILMSLLFKQTVHSIKDLQGVIPEIVKKIPDERIFRQEMILEELSAKIMEIFDPKCLYSNLKMKERIALYMEEYTVKKNDLKADLCTKLVPSLHFLENMQHYLSTYQKEIIKLKSQINALEQERNRYQALLDKKSLLTPLNIDYDKLYEMKEKTNQAIRQDLEQNIIQYHEEKHRRDQKIIFEVEQLEHKLRDQNDELKNTIAQLNQQLSNLKSNAPQFADYGVQVYLISQGKSSDRSTGQSGGMTAQFLDNVITPFSFNRQIAGSLINVLSIDKILFDYETIRQRDIIRSFEEFLFQWFIIRTGCRRIAQIFIKNFLYSLKQLRTSHKRFAIFYRVCGHSGFRKRNMQEDLEGVFFTTHLCWYYIVKLSLMYRRKLSQNPTGYHLFPPLQCEDIFKLPLRKIYELVEQFLKSEELDVPSDLTQLIDHYCINQISKFKSSDEAFQKESLEEIHILRDINFDLIAGFVIEYIANLKCTVVEKLLRTIDSKQKQEGNVLGYSEFEGVYRRYFKERRAKIEQIYAKLCMVNQHDMLDIENLHPVVFTILEDQSPLRSIFEKLEPLKVLIVSDKAAIVRTDKKPTNVNSYENFRERYYHEFYDFYNTTAFLEEIFKIVRVLAKKRLKKGHIADEYIERLVEFKIDTSKMQGQGKRKSSSGSSEEQQEEASNRAEEEGATTERKQSAETKNLLVSKLEQWSKIMTRVPHFATKVLTIDQIIIHNMRRKQMIDATEFAWRTLREILTILGKE